MKKHLLAAMMMGLSLSSFAQFWDSLQQNTYLPQSRGIQTISVIDSSIIWADTYDGSGGGAAVTDFINTLDGGTTWVANSISNVPVGWEFSHFAGFSDAMAWATCFNSTANGAHVYRTLDGGLTWEEKNPYSAAAFADVIHFFNDQEGVTIGDPVGGYYEIYTTADQGETWTRVPQANIPAPLAGEYGLTRSIGSYGDNVWYGTNKSRIFRSSDKGMTWAVSDLSAIVAPTTQVAGAISDFAMESATTGMCFISSADTVNRLVKTTDGGATWTQVLSNTQKAGFIKWRSGLAHVPGSVPSRYFITGARANFGDHGSVYTEDMGATWVTVDSAVQHLGTGWADYRHGWSGGFTGTGGTGGMFKWKDTTAFGTGVLVPWTNGEVLGYPNPAQSVYTISMEQFVKGAVINLSLTDVTGKEVYSYELPTFNGKFKHSINLENLNTGMYFLNLQVGNQMITKKIMKN